jgi:hypothetical protein
MFKSQNLVANSGLLLLALSGILLGLSTEIAFPQFALAQTASYTYVRKVASPMVFSRACEPGEKLIISSVGDVLPQSGLSVQAYASPIGFKSLWLKAIPYFQAADLSYGNLEGPVAPGVALGGVNVPDPGPHLDGRVYSATHFSFNYNPRILNDLKDSGFDIMSNVNNHLFDRGILGVDRTVESYQNAGLAFVGAHHTGDSQSPFYTVIKQKNFNIAFVGCTQNMNAHMGSSQQVLLCIKDEAQIKSILRELSQNPAIDAVILTPHWGTEYHHNADEFHRRLAHEFLDAGATAIVGSHPHVLEELEYYKTIDGRETIVAYSLGNFVSFQGQKIGHKLTTILYLGLTKAPAQSLGQKAWVNGVSYVPMWMDRGPHAINTLEQSRQAPRSLAEPLLYSLFDSSRRLAVGAPIRTDLDCR